MREKAPAAPSALPAEALFAACDETLLPFATTAELPAGGEIVGQGRATEALRLALGMKAAGYNLFALGPSGVGKFTFVRHAVEKAARRWPTPPDWCYINNFAEPHRPKALELPSGRGRPQPARICSTMAGSACGRRRSGPGSRHFCSKSHRLRC